jgi:hypothetical protein
LVRNIGTCGGLLWIRWCTFGFWRHVVSEYSLKIPAAFLTHLFIVTDNDTCVSVRNSPLWTETHVIINTLWWSDVS